MKAINRGQYSILGVYIHAVNYAATVEQIITAAQQRRGLTVGALAVHGVVTGALDTSYRHQLNHLDLIVPDGQPVRWALALRYGVYLPDRVYGPTLTLKVCQAAAERGLSVYLYGTTQPTLRTISAVLLAEFPALVIAGTMPSAFGQVSAGEQAARAQAIRASNADIVLCGLGCPRQEIWLYEHRQLLQKPMLGVGAAFDFIAGNKPQAPGWMQRAGLEWLFRLLQEPRRLWRRYLLLNPVYIALFGAQWLRLWHPSTTAGTAPPPQRYA
jgi:N-acetylglucosaminyldiphosphoundecaprenol N-acetyl-beta-D-mannosaminyltransferase